MLAAFWAEDDPDRPAVISDAGNRTRAEANANANRLVRALRARGVQAGDGIALMCSNRPEFFEAVAAARRAGLRLTTVNWHLTGDEAGYIVDDCEATTFVADARFAAVARAAADLAPKLLALVAVGGPIDGFEDVGRRARPGVGRRHRRSGRRQHDALHVGHDGPTEGRSPSARSARRPRRRRADPVPRQPARAPLHRPAVPRGAAVVLVDRARGDGRAGRDDGRLVGGAHARVDRRARRDAHAHGADDVPPAALAARRA